MNGETFGRPCCHDLAQGARDRLLKIIIVFHLVKPFQ
jgi:hypothetical protein